MLMPLPAAPGAAPVPAVVLVPEVPLELVPALPPGRTALDVPAVVPVAVVPAVVPAGGAEVPAPGRPVPPNGGCMPTPLMSFGLELLQAAAKMRHVRLRCEIRMGIGVACGFGL
jgi:hypothetical protein